MAVHVLTNAGLLVNAVDLSAYLARVALAYDADVVDVSAMAATPVKNYKVGATGWTMEVEFFQDYAASKVDATLFPLVGAVAFAIILKSTNAVESSTNPHFTGNAFLKSYSGPVSGAFNDSHKITASFIGDGALTRDVTP